MKQSTEIKKTYLDINNLLNARVSTYLDNTKRIPYTKDNKRFTRTVPDFHLDGKLREVGGRALTSSLISNYMGRIKENEDALDIKQSALSVYRLRLDLGSAQNDIRNTALAALRITLGYGGCFMYYDHLAYIYDQDRQSDSIIGQCKLIRPDHVKYISMNEITGNIQVINFYDSIKESYRLYTNLMIVVEGKSELYNTDMLPFLINVHKDFITKIEERDTEFGSLQVLVMPSGTVIPEGQGIREVPALKGLPIVYFDSTESGEIFGLPKLLKYFVSEKEAIICRGKLVEMDAVLGKSTLLASGIKEVNQEMVDAMAQTGGIITSESTDTKFDFISVDFTGSENMRQRIVSIESIFTETGASLSNVSATEIVEKKTEFLAVANDTVSDFNFKYNYFMQVVDYIISGRELPLDTEVIIPASFDYVNPEQEENIEQAPEQASENAQIFANPSPTN